MAPLWVYLDWMQISKRTHLELGALLVLLGLSVVAVSVFRFDAFVESDQRFRKEFEPYLITHQLGYPKDPAENKRKFLHRDMIYHFHPSGSRYSRTGEMLLCTSSGLTVIAMGAFICLRARRRGDQLV